MQGELLCKCFSLTKVGLCEERRDCSGCKPGPQRACELSCGCELRSDSLGEGFK